MRSFRRLCIAAVLTAAFTMPALADGGETHGPGVANPVDMETPTCMDPGETQGPPCVAPGEKHGPDVMDAGTLADVVFALQRLVF
jgi:hypothetical protein